ncbi:ElyC/SanA/YdcF family protein [soil metagenome]
MKQKLKVLFITLGVVVALIATNVAGVIFIMQNTESAFTYTAETIPNHRVAIVFGAAVRRDGSLSPILLDRVLAGVDLLKSGKVERLLMTGDNGSVDYDEVSAMKKNAIAAGATAEQIVLDYAGFSTYDSCYRAKEIFGVTDAVLVTQKFHLTRALYLCRSMGMQADGLAIEDFSKYPNLKTSYTIREYAASYKAWLDITFLTPTPKYLGKFEGPI